MFKKFSDVPQQDVEENEHFRSHALQVTESLSLAVATLEDMDSVVMLLKDLGGAHTSHNLQTSHFEVSCVERERERE